MKGKIITCLSLAISIAALGYSIWMHQNTLHMVDEALREREQRLVRAFAPRMEKAMRDMGATNIIANPKTLEELFGPLVEMMNGMDQVPSDKGVQQKH